MLMKDAQKIAYTVNSVMLSMVFGLWFFFRALEADFLVWFSVPTALVYTVTYFLIYKEKLEAYLWLCYGWLIIYTGITTVCLGDCYGFHFYCFSMIPCVYVVEYMSFKLGRRNVKSLNISICVAVFYLLFMSYLALNGPIYDTGERFAAPLRMFNSMTVFSYLVIYTNYLIRSIISSETKLKNLAHKDRLTGLYNRHYMLDKLTMLPNDSTAGVLAMVDIDDYKKINDTYGHNAGDEVLRVISAKMNEICDGCDIARWGGEEFLILCSGNSRDVFGMLDRMRFIIGSEPVIFEDSRIKVTITVGMAQRNDDETTDEWIHQIDRKLYDGKKNGKNRVVA